MGQLRALLLALCATVPTPAFASPLDRWEPYIAEAAGRFRIPAAWIRRVMRAESGGQTRLNGRPIESHAGAMGLMQLMPGTWRAMRAAYGLGDDPHHPRDNIIAGSAYLRAMYDRFGYPGLFAAYNAGPGRYSEYLRRGRRLPAETITYMSRVAGREPAASATRLVEPAPGPEEPPALFAMHFGRPARPSGAETPTSPPVPSLFVILRSSPQR